MMNFCVGPHIHHYDKVSVQGGQWFQRRLKYVMFADGQADRGRRKASSDGDIYLSIMVLLAPEG